MKRNSRSVNFRHAALLLALLAMPLLSGGCALPKLASAMGAAEEAQKVVEVPAKYAGLENHTVAVVVEADYSTTFERPGLVSTIASGVTMRIARWVPGVQVLDPTVVLNWQYSKPQWHSLPYGDIAEQLNVDRVVFVEILEYRLNPPGNRWLWDGVAVARVGVIERHGLDQDNFTDTFDVTAKFPGKEGVGRESAAESQIEAGVLIEFVKHIAWLFHFHYEPKHPDMYRPELDTKQMKEMKSATGS